MNGEEICERCSEKKAVGFIFQTPQKTLNLCVHCLTEVSYYMRGCMEGDYRAGPKFYDLKCKAILYRVSNEEDLKAVLCKRKTAIRLVKHLIEVSNTVQESLLTYFEASKETEEYINRVKTQSNLRYEQVTTALEKLVSSWKTYDFWKHPPSPLAQMIFNHRKSFLFLFFRQVLFYPSLAFESYLKLEYLEGLSISECIDLIVRGLTKEERTRLITGFDLVIAQETNIEDQIALEHTSDFLQEHLYHPRFLHIDRSLEYLISEELGVEENTYQEDMSRIISSSWRTVSLQVIGCLYYRHKDSFEYAKTLEEIEAAARFMCKFFPWHESALSFCKFIQENNSSGDFGLCVKLMLTVRYYQGDAQYSLRKLYQAARDYADLEVCVIQKHIQRMVYGNPRPEEMRAIYRE